jgi:hypothetical protein
MTLDISITSVPFSMLLSTNTRSLLPPCEPPPHPPIPLAPAALTPAVRATSPVPSSPRPSFSPPLLRPSLLPLHSMPYCTASLYSVVYYTARACPQRPEGAPATSPKRRRSPLGSSVPVLVCDRIDNWYNTRIRVVYQYTSILRFLSFVPPTPELILYCIIALYAHNIYIHMVPVFIRSTGILINRPWPLAKANGFILVWESLTGITVSQFASSGPAGPGGTTRMKVTDMPVAVIQVRPPGYFIHVSITTPIVSALKNYYHYR